MAERDYAAPLGFRLLFSRVVQLEAQIASIQFRDGTFCLQARIIPVRPNQEAETASNPVPPWLGEPP